MGRSPHRRGDRLLCRATTHPGVRRLGENDTVVGGGDMPLAMRVEQAVEVKFDDDGPGQRRGVVVG